MRTVIMLGVIALILFGLSAGGSWYLQQWKDKHEPAAETSSQSVSTPLQKPASAVASLGPLQGTRPSAGPSAEKAVAESLAAKNRQYEDRVQKQKDADHLKVVQLAYQDIRGEIAVQDDARRKLDETWKALKKEREDLDRKATELDKWQQKLDQQENELKKKSLDLETLEAEQFRKQAAAFDVMDATAAAKIFEEMVRSKKADNAVKILAGMRERQAAKVLAELSTIAPALAAELLDKMKGLKRPQPPTPAK